MFSNWLMYLFILLPVAFISGWWIAKSNLSATGKNGKKKIHPDYFKGLHYVLDEQPDKAIEIFVKMLEVDSETIETHMALGNLFRRRGEVDRAIRIHQNLIARPALNKEYRAQALLELGMDYLKLGILDRAEGLFLELISMDILTDHAFANLLDIYQQEKEWEKAISIARRLVTISGDHREVQIAQFYCELAQINIQTQDYKIAKNNLKKALRLDPKCVRASLMEGEMLMHSGNYSAAIKSYERVEKQNTAYIDEIILPLQECYERNKKQKKFKGYLEYLIERNHSIRSIIILTDIIAAESGVNDALNFMSEQLNLKPTVQGVDHFMNYVLKKSEGDLKTHLSSVKKFTTKLLEEIVIYKCNLCGFEVRNLHWQCPSCKNWESVKPLQRV